MVKVSVMKQSIVSLAIAAFLSNALVASAQDIQQQNEPGGPPATRKAAPPAALPPRPLNMPKPISYKMPNGLMVVLLEDHRVPFVTFQLGMRAGDSADPKALPGLAAITADMLNEGTAHRTSKQIASEIDFIGGAMKATADPDFTILSGSGLSKYQDRFFDIVSDVLLNPSFPEDELKLEKTNLLQELTMKRSQPDFLADERFHKVVFGNTPYAVLTPTKESIEKITQADLKAFHDNKYVPNASTLVVVGDFNLDKMKALIEKSFGGWHSGAMPETADNNAPAQTGRKIYLIDRPGSVQSSVKIGNVGIKKNDADFFPAIVANQILGGSSNSRLFLNIREQKGYTYGAYSNFAARKQPGEFYAGGSVRSAVTAPSLQEFLYELDRIRKLPVSSQELSSAKNYLVGSFQLGFETQGGVAQRLLEQQMYDLPSDYLGTYADKVLAVTPDDVRRVARNHIDLNNLVITVVGDAKQIEPELMYFAPVDVYDTNGSLVRETKEAANHS